MPREWSKTERIARTLLSIPFVITLVLLVRSAQFIGITIYYAFKLTGEAVDDILDIILPAPADNRKDGQGEKV